MSPASLLEDLNEPQREAVKHLQGPILILAGAGSGKTRVITYRVAHLIQQRNVQPYQVLAVTFTNKAAEEMRERVASLLRGQIETPLISTFHSFAVRILRRYAASIGYRSNFTICDADDQLRILKNIYREGGLSNEELPIRLVRSRISWGKNQGWAPESFERSAPDRDAPLIARVYGAYQSYLVSSNAVDFDDLLLLSVRLLRDNPEIRDSYSSRYRQLLIDEYQDTNTLQYEMIRLLTTAHDNVCAVGDEDQSIYRFRGADIQNILRFEKDFPGTRLIKLEQNYRSTQVVLDAAGALVSHNRQRKGKVLWTSRKGGDRIDLFVADNAYAEAHWVAGSIQQQLRQGVAKVAVLYRTNAQSREFEEALNTLRIPFRLIGGVSFYSRKEVKDALAYLRLALNPDDNVSFMRILNEPARGIGKKTLERLLDIAGEMGLSLGLALQESLRSKAFPARAHMALRAFDDLVERCRSHLGLPLHEALERILETSGYSQALQAEGTEEAESRLANLKELVNAAEASVARETPLQAFLDEAALRADSDDYDASAAVSLMTLHNAKGLEFGSVFLAGLEQGLFPHQRALDEMDIEEERRLCYVGLTRARDKLQLSYSRQRRYFGKKDSGHNQPSDFLGEIPEDLVRQVFGAGSSAYSTGGAAFPKTFPAPQARRQKTAFAGPTYNTKKSVEQFLSNLNQVEAPNADRVPKAASGGIVKGSMVVHPEFGRGKVLAVQKSGDDLKVTVHFPGTGIKKMLQRYAKLERA